MNIFRRRERHGLHVADPLTEAPGYPQTATQSLSPHVRAELDRLRGQALAEQQAAREHGPWYGHGMTMPDQRAAHDRPYVPATAAIAAITAPPPPVPVTAAESASRMARLAYPEPDATRERYAAVMRQVSAYTGTRSAFDWPAAWTSARPGVPEAPVTCWTLLSAPPLAIEAPKEVAA